MKNFLRFFLSVAICLLALTNISFSQNPIPNAEFENWSGNTPNGWGTPSNIPLAGIEPITKSPEAYSDSWAVRGFVLDFSGTPIVPVLFTGTLNEALFPVNGNYQMFSCFYKYFGVGEDMLFIDISFVNLSVGGGGEGHVEISAENSQIFDRLEIPINYSPNNPPGWQATNANITISIKPQENEVPHPGTWFLLDHFTFDNLPSGIKLTDNNQVPDQFTLKQNYPNPFNPTTNINFSIPEESFVNLKVYNLQGEEVATIVNENLEAGNYSADWNAAQMPSGVYIYTLKSNSINLSRKMILMK
ncbi:MAG: T9SS type A sorting domain-containing protein [Ignavibacteriaceae bacterium]